MEKPITQTAFKLVNTQVVEIKYNVKEIFKKDISKALDLNIGHEILFSTKQEKNFFVKFFANLQNPQSTFSLRIVFLAIFESKDNITDDFRESSFVHINAPAIAFPYFRSFISTLTINSGIPPIVLPTFNFSKIKSIKKKAEQSNGRRTKGHVKTI